MSILPLPLRATRVRLAAAVVGTALAGTLGMAHATVYNPPINMVHGIEYMTGGVGPEEAQLMETVLPRWPASFVFSVPGQDAAALATAIEVTVRNAAGEVVLDHVHAGGPFMVARLAPGKYQVQVELDGQALTQEITVHDGVDTRTEFKWPAGTVVHQARN